MSGRMGISASHVTKSEIVTEGGIVTKVKVQLKLGL
jgi:hypothetical protein